jgi:predicted  nucleic acid-binding Zn-ribbon protein
MSNCVNCGHSYSLARKELGYKTCLDCGDKSASQQTKEKASRVTCAYNKSGLMYVHDIKTTLNYERKRN